MSQFPPQAGLPASDDWMNRVERLPFSFANAFSQGWATFKANYGVALVSILAAAGVLIGASILTQVFQFLIIMVIGLFAGNSQGGGGIAMVIAMILSFVMSIAMLVCLQWPTHTSLAYSAVAVARGEPATARNILRGFHKYARSLSIMLAITILAMAIIIPVVTVLICSGAALGQAASAAGGRGGNAAGAVLIAYPLMMIMLILGFSYLTSRLGLAVALAMDDHVREMGTIECLKLSWEMTKPKSVELFGLYVVLYFMNAFGLMALCLPAIFFTGPLTLAIVGAAYHQLAFGSGLFRSPFICSKCGYPVQPGMPVCPECGASTTYAQPAAYPTPPTAFPAGPSQNPFPPQDPFAPRDPQDPYGPRQ